MSAHSRYELCKTDFPNDVRCMSSWTGKPIYFYINSLGFMLFEREKSKCFASV